MPEPKRDVTGFGEVMLRLSVPVGRRLETTHRLDVFPGGSEGNVVYALARLGRRTGWVSALPSTALGRIIANNLRNAGVDLDGVIWSAAGRVGTYYVEFSAPPRPIQVIYDRADSAIAIFGRARDAEPWYPAPRLALAKVYDRYGFTAEALAEYEAFMARAPKSMAAQLEAAGQRITALKAEQ